MPYSGIFGLEFENNNVIFEISALELVLYGKFREKMKMPKFGTKNALFGYFWVRILKNYCHIWNQHPQICLFPKFRGKTNILKFETKNAWFGYFWTGIWKQYCHIEIRALEFVRLQNFAKKQKCLNFGTKVPHLGIFGLES